MKRISLAVLAAVLCFFTACGNNTSDKNTDTENADAPSADVSRELSVGDVLDVPEKTASLDGVNKLTMKYTSGYTIDNEWVTVDLTIGFDKCDIRDRYYRGVGFSDGGSSDVICDVENGTEKVYLKNHDGYYLFDGAYYEEFEKQEQGFVYEYATFGFDYSDYMEDTSFEKLPDEQHDGKSYYSYVLTGKDKIYGDELSMEILVDKQTGIWVRTVSQVEQDGELYSYETIVSEVVFDAKEVPGVTPTLMQEQTIYDANDVKIVATALEYTNTSYAATLLIKTVNDRSSAISISSNYFDVNGLCLGGSVVDYSCNAGETKVVAVDIPINAVYESGIDIIDEIALSLRITDSEYVQPDEPGIEAYYSEVAVIEERTQEKILVTDCPDSFVQSIETDGEILIDTTELYLVARKLYSEDGRIYLKAYCENRTDKPIRTTINFKSINGIETDLYGKISMQEGRIGYGVLTLYEYELEKYGITELENAVISCEAFSGETVIGSERVLEETAPVKLTAR